FPGPYIGFTPISPLTGRRLQAQKIGKMGCVPVKCQNYVEKFWFSDSSAPFPESCE
ncbi:hypothetical protein NDU88_002151, partial [Pleurodeles waltl]